MKALILAAGRGERMRPLTDHLPKPLLEVRGKPLVAWHLEALARAGVHEVVINTAWLEERFPERLGDGQAWGLRIRYSFEGRDHGGALETAGGIATALPLLADAPDDPFWVVSGDVFLPGFDFATPAVGRFSAGSMHAHLWMVPNAPHHPGGDFGIDAEGRATADGAPRYTWASVGLVRASLVEGLRPGTRQALRPCLDASIRQRRITAELWSGGWTDVGTPERLAELNR